MSTKPDRIVIAPRSRSGRPPVRLVTVLALLAFVAVACGGDRAPSGPVSYGDPNATSVPAAPPAESSPETTATDGSGDRGARPPARTAPPTTETNRGGTSPGPGESGPEPSPSSTNAPAAVDDGQRLGPPGAYARTLLRPTPATSIVVEVISEPGNAPSDATVSLVERRLEEVSGKQVTVRRKESSAGAPRGDWTPPQIVEFAERHAEVPVTNSVAVVRFLGLSDGLQDAGNAIGVAVRGDVFAVFTGKVRSSGSPLVDPATVEQAVAVHEIGHLLGLVDIAIDRDRDDPEHPFHSPNRGSVMFWAIETDLVGQVLGGPPPRTFDADDLADLAALRNGA